MREARSGTVPASTMTDLDLFLRFLLQAILVLAACKGIGWLGRRFLGQTQVVMEMVTGVLLGPSLFGLLMPDIQGKLFPMKADVIEGPVTHAGVKHPSMMILYVVAQLGLVLYMFLVGQEFDTELLKKKTGAALSVSFAGIVVPFALGALIAVTLLKDRTDLFAPGISLGNQLLYLGAAMCITAFPMLARIIFERGIANTRMGTLALGAGAFDDAVAWSILAVVLAVAKGSANYWILAIGGGLLFAVVVMTLGKRLFLFLGREAEATGRLSQDAFVWTMLFLLLGAYVTDAIGIYAVFGAFVIGAAMPRGRFAALVKEKLEAVTVGLLLPFFFVYSGLNTKLGLINSSDLWIIAIVILLAAIAGKGLACALAAKVSGESWQDSAAIGTLMNARGLMELIILNIGLQQKVITPTLYTIMVVMAIVTTLMASPIFARIMRGRTAADLAAA